MVPVRALLLLLKYSSRYLNSVFASLRLQVAGVRGESKKTANVIEGEKKKRPELSGKH